MLINEMGRVLVRQSLCLRCRCSRRVFPSTCLKSSGTRRPYQQKRRGASFSKIIPPQYYRNQLRTGPPAYARCKHQRYKRTRRADCSVAHQYTHHFDRRTVCCTKSSEYRTTTFYRSTWLERASRKQNPSYWRTGRIGLRYLLFLTHSSHFFC